MPVDDLSDPNAALRAMQKKLQRTPVTSGSTGGGGGDAGHEGSGLFSIELGNVSVSSGTGSTAVGYAAEANADSATAVGRQAQAIQTASVAVGMTAVADGVDATAIGHGAVAEASWTFAAGSSASAGAAEGTALGTWAIVGSGHDGSTAVGANSETTAAHQIMLGTSGDRVRVPGSLNLTSYTPTGTADTAGVVGDVTYATNFIYVKTSAGWKRSALSTF